MIMAKMWWVDWDPQVVDGWGQVWWVVGWLGKVVLGWFGPRGGALVAE